MSTRSDEVRKILNEQACEIMGLPPRYFSIKDFATASFAFRKRFNFLRSSFGRVVETPEEWEKDIRDAFHQITTGKLDAVQLSVFKFTKSKFNHPANDYYAVGIFLDWGILIDEAEEEGLRNCYMNVEGEGTSWNRYPDSPWGDIEICRHGCTRDPGDLTPHCVYCDYPPEANIQLLPCSKCGATAYHLDGKCLACGRK